MLSIGEFSKVTQVTVKALRLYHEQGILIPDKIDNDSGYRYYGSDSVKKAVTIRTLKDLGFSLKEIKEIQAECSDYHQLTSYLENKLREINKNIKQYKEMKESLESAIANPREKIGLEIYDIEEEIIPDSIICSIRYKGKYSDIGQHYGTLFKNSSRYKKGKPFALYYDMEYKEYDADVEACIGVVKKLNLVGIQCRELKGGKVLTLLHRGPYQTLGRSYERLFKYIREKNVEIKIPLREMHIKGPGMFFKTNPQKYLTKIILFCKDKN
jgi:DNA-binding transcriptional MerR regulator